MKKIIDENKNNIKKIIRNITGSDNDDLEQEVYIKVWNSQKTGNPILKFTNWVNKITANTCKDFLKSKQYRQSKMICCDDDAINDMKEIQTPEAKLEIKQRQKYIMTAIDELPKKMKEVILLYEFEQMSYDDISIKLNIPVGTVKSRLSCARTVLKEELKELLGD